MCVKDSNYNLAAERQNLSSVCPTKRDSNQFTRLQRQARKMKAEAQSNFQKYWVTYKNVRAMRAIYSGIVTLFIILLVIPAAKMPPVKEHFQL